MSKNNNITLSPEVISQALRHLEKTFLQRQEFSEQLATG